MELVQSSDNEASRQRPQLILVGAGLANALIAQCVSAAHPGLPILMLEGSANPFGDHTWSFHAGDVSPADFQWLRPLVAHSWPAQSVRFDGYRRELSTAYACLNSGTIAAAMAGLPNLTLRTNAAVKRLEPGKVVLEDGTGIEAPCIIDGRGFMPHPALVLGHQKFVGLEIETAAPHGVDVPVIMDATVDQKDGYRFVYLLPFSPTRILVEDTRYSDSSSLSRADLEGDIRQYAQSQGWTVAKVVRTEQGILPIALGHDIDRFWSGRGEQVPQVGMRAALFHPTTGYSLPEAVRLAALVAERWPVDTETLAQFVRRHAMTLHRRQGYYRMLNRLLFLGAPPQRRHVVMRRFYTLPQPLIERFYAGRLRWRDKVRILFGKPPIPIHHALLVLREAPVLASVPE